MTTPSADSASIGMAESSPIAGLYRHALQSVFTFCSFADLTAALAVCSRWNDAIIGDGMPLSTQGVHIFPPALADMCSSKLVRLITRLTIGDFSSPTVSEIKRLADTAPQLTDLHFMLPTELSEPIVLPPRLHKLHLQLLDGGTTVAFGFGLDAVLVLGYLSELSLTLPTTLHDYNRFHVLSAASPSLTSLRICFNYQDHVLTDKQVCDLRGLTRITSLEIPHIDASSLSRLLAVPHNLSWQRLIVVHPCSIDERTMEQITSLPTLTALYGDITTTTTGASSLRFMDRLPQLREISIGLHECQVSPQRMMEGMQACHQLTDLSFNAAALFTCANVTELLSHLPMLQRLHLSDMSMMESIRFLSDLPSLARTLTHLVLWQCKMMPITEFAHVNSLTALESLNVYDSFDGPIDAAIVAAYTPPSIRLPKLNNFEYWHVSELYALLAEEEKAAQKSEKQ